MSAKKFFRVLAMMSAVLMLTTLLLTGCGGNNTDNSKTETSSNASGANADPVTIRIAGGGQLLVTRWARSIPSASQCDD